MDGVHGAGFSSPSDARDQKSWDARLGGTLRDGCGTNPVFAGFFVAPPADGGSRLLVGVFPTFGAFRGGWGRF